MELAKDNSYLTCSKLGLLLIVVQFGMHLIHIDAGQTCSSCSGVDLQEGCHHQITCNDTEECYIHKYQTESGVELSDLGCTVPQLCPSGVAPILGKRTEGHHFQCMACCNDTALCNQNMTCIVRAIGAARLPRDCSELEVPVRRNGTYIIFPYGTLQYPASVLCEFIGSDAWTVIQRRFDGSVNFYRSWDAYKYGFGSSDGEYWLGNDFIHMLTSNGNNILRVVVEDWQNVTRYANYRTFRVAGEDHDYYLSVWGYSGNAGDAMNYHDGMKFSTLNRDNDVAYSYHRLNPGYHSSDCVESYKSCWWFKDCFQADLNGQYYTTSFNSDFKGIHWSTFHPSNYTLRATKMMIKRY